MVSGAHMPSGSSRWRRWVAARRLRGWPVDAWSGFLGGVLASLLLLGLLTWKAEWVADLTLGANPSCSSPRGLRQVEIVGATAKSTQAEKADGDFHGEPVTSADGSISDDYLLAEYAMDDASNTVWVPEIINDYPPGQGNAGVAPGDEARASREPKFRTTDDANRLTLTLRDTADVRLVCVVNGNALWYTSYENWGRVRSLNVWGDDGDKKLGTLQSLGSEDFPNSQVAGRNLGDTGTVNLELVDAYAGIRVENFNARACLDGARVKGTDQKPMAWLEGRQDVELAGDILLRWPDGCILEPKVKAGIAEVRVYATD